MSMEGDFNALPRQRHNPEARVIDCVELRPTVESPEVPAERGVVFLPGWKLDAQSAPVESISQLYADESHSKTLIVTSETKNREMQKTGREPDYMYEEARLIADKILESGLREVTLVGHSQGGSKAIDVAVHLQQQPDVIVRGLILINPVGLRERSSIDLALHFLEDGASATAKKDANRLQRLKNRLKVMKTSAIVGKNVAKDVVSLGTAYPSSLWSEVREMAQTNPHMEDVEAPVIIVQSSGDLIANEDQWGNAYGDKLARDGRSYDKPITIVHEDGKEEIRGGSGDKQLNVQESREYTYKVLRFPKSPYIREVIAEGPHLLPYMRPEAVVTSSLSLLERYLREAKEASSS